MDLTTVFLILLTLIGSAFFSGMEIAFITANKLRIELANRQGTLSGSILSKFIKEPGRFLSIILVGNNIMLVIYGTLMAKWLEPIIFQLLPLNFNGQIPILLIQTIVSTILVLIFGEFLPKSVFKLNPNSLLVLFAVPMQICYILLYPLVWVISNFSRLFLKLIGVTTDKSGPSFEKVDLDYLVQESSQSQEEHEDQEVEINIFQNALYFNEIKARDCMVPRTELIAIEKTSTMAELSELFRTSGLSRLLVYDDNIDNIIGFVHFSNLFNNPKTIDSIILPIPIVPETMLGMQLLKVFNKERKAIALVVDEFGGTSGIVTLEDIMEEIFGEIEDEHDTEELTEQLLEDGSYIFSARLEVDYLNEKYNLDIPEGDYNTLGGYIIEQHESIPEKGEELSCDNFNIIIQECSLNRIETVKIQTILNK